MGFTIEDMRVTSADRYKMKLLAGKNGWSNSISWLLMLEELTIIQNFTGKELAVTTGLGFQSEEAMLELVKQLSAHSASGLIVNTGFYIHEIPPSVLAFCDDNDLPLLTVPWETVLADLIKDLSIRIFLQTSADEQISASLIHAIETPEARDLYINDLLPYFDLDGTFQVAMVTTGNLDRMDTVDRKRISDRMQLYLANLTHNGHFFYYDSFFVIVMNAVKEEDCAEILAAFSGRAQKKMPSIPAYIGVSDIVSDITNLHIAYRRAKSAAERALHLKKPLLFFGEMGIYRLLCSVGDKALLQQMAEEPLHALLASDREENTEYVETLRMYLKHSGSIKAMAEEMYIHRNTILYRMAAIRRLLNNPLETTEERLPYIIAFKIREM